jgi:predicted metal-dependent hydrolase
LAKNDRCKATSKLFRTKLAVSLLRLCAHAGSHGRHHRPATQHCPSPHAGLTAMNGTVTYSSHQLTYRLRSARRTMAITVHPAGDIEVVAPKGTDPENVKARVRKRARWIVRQQLYFEQFRPRSKPRRYVNGETHLYLGRQYRLKLKRAEEGEVKLKGGFLIVALPRKSSSRRIRDLVKAWYQERAKDRLMDRYGVIAPRFALRGRRIAPPIIRSMSRRWGSYSKSGRILLNPDLVRASRTSWRTAFIQITAQDFLNYLKRSCPTGWTVRIG